jgi:hypothetical protein
MDPREFLGLAKDLLDATPNAVACRTAIGRSYYAALNVALSMLSELNIRLDRDEDSHKRLAQILDSRSLSENQDWAVLHPVFLAPLDFQVSAHW